MQVSGQPTPAMALQVNLAAHSSRVLVISFREQPCNSIRRGRQEHRVKATEAGLALLFKRELAAVRTISGMVAVFKNGNGLASRICRLLGVLVVIYVGNNILSFTPQSDLC